MAEFNDKGKYPTVHFRVKAWVHADGKVKLVGDDEDLPGNGMFITVRSDTDTEKNIKGMIDALNPDVVLSSEVDSLLDSMTLLQKQKLVVLLQEEILEDEKDQILTPYAAAKLLQEWGLPIREQMVYSYVAEGRIETVAKNRIRESDLRDWAEEYRARNVS